MSMSMVLSYHGKAIARVNTVHLMNAECQVTANHQANRIGLSAGRLLPSTSTIAVYYYCSARKLMLILSSH